MPNGGLFVGWGPIIPGREKSASQVLGSAHQYLARLHREGEIESFDTILLEPHGGDLEGFVVVRGNRERLAKLRTEPEFLSVIVGVQLVHANVRVVGAYAGPEMLSLLKIWEEQEARLL